MKKIALDTNVAIALLNGNSEIVTIIQSFDSIYLPITVCGELLYGAKNSAKSKTNLEFYRNFINACAILDTNAIVADEYSDIRLELKSKGNPIPENDIWIAALCRAYGIPLYTLDRHFANISNLNIFSLI
ncbi:type II toxin-antitoxin system VapC family toxin [Haliscomenobacter hydrossis]|uniref:Ribonuclease VapC n=1 Tax=Haliscomenobacter hydrossis (strain ATCC 27775 / DSM 1100 / LMG 10767 / O) TaxID=760192 RepID=F4L4D5_HALH1|nr:type II toxin-antitoxin system VapC family toxin [Haliscomenobacter hydrossis]AEE51804.1 PilT protein domain protein [Haliscomenobacter hydrossis DSM 1100]